jgi:hypothetical protein
MLALRAAPIASAHADGSYQSSDLGNLFDGFLVASRDGQVNRGKAQLTSFEVRRE